MESFKKRAGSVGISLGPLIESGATPEDNALADILRPHIVYCGTDAFHIESSVTAARIAREYAQAVFGLAAAQRGSSPGMRKVAFLTRAGFRADEL